MGQSQTLYLKQGLGRNFIAPDGKLETKILLINSWIQGFLVGECEGQEDRYSLSLNTEYAMCWPCDSTRNVSSFPVAQQIHRKCPVRRAWSRSLGWPRRSNGKTTGKGGMSMQKKNLSLQMGFKPRFHNLSMIHQIHASKANKQNQTQLL